MELILCLYLVSVLYELAENLSPQRARRDPAAVARAALEAAVWPLALLPWREWPSQVRQAWQAVPARYGAMA
jgi:hypothetical protein